MNIAASLDNNDDLFDWLEKRGIRISSKDQKRPLGSGAFATVYRGTMTGKPERECAVKIWHHPVSQNDPAVRREVEAVQKLYSEPVGSLPNLVKLLHEPLWPIDHNQQERFVTIWELAKDGSLDALQKRNYPDGMPRSVLLPLLDDIAAAIDGLSDYDWTHRDVKPANVLLFGNRAKLGDFGLFRLQGASTVHTQGLRGTPEFMPPEAVADGHEVSPTFDAYSFGAMYGWLRRGGRSVFANPQKTELDLTGLDGDEMMFIGQLCSPQSADRPRGRIRELLQPLMRPAVNVSESTTPPGDSTELTANWLEACDALIDAGMEYRQIEMELLIQQQAKSQLLSAYRPPREMVREQDVRIATVRKQLHDQLQVVQARIHAREHATDACSQALQQELAWLINSEHGPGHSPEDSVVRDVQVQIETLANSRRTWLRGDPLDETGISRVLTARQFVDESRNLIRRRVSAIEIPLLEIPPGEFFMGAADDEGDSSNDEKPRHLVRITRPFWIGQYPVTIRQILNWLNDPEVKFDSTWIELSNVECPVEKKNNLFVLKRTKFGQSLDQPMVFISWAGCIAYCEWASLKDPELTYSLPTEAQWEYACRAGTATRWYFGDDEADLDDYGLYSGNSGSTTHPVGGKGTNPWEIHDLHHVWQWCLDWYDENYYQSSPINDPAGPQTNQQSRVQRGGSWCDRSPDTRSAHRTAFAPVARSSYCGFRVCCESASSRIRNS